MTMDEQVARFRGRFVVMEQLLPPVLFLTLRMQPDPQKALTVLRESFEKGLSKAAEDGGRYEQEAEKIAAELFEGVARALQQGATGFPEAGAD